MIPSLHQGHLFTNDTVNVLYTYIQIQAETYSNIIYELQWTNEHISL